MIVFENERFTLFAPEHPHIDRADGGHLRINPRRAVENRQELTPSEAIELMRLTIVAGEAMTNAMNARGVDIGRINYQDNGNWSVEKPEGPKLHVHLYGRAKGAKRQLWGEALTFPKRADRPEFYEGLAPLTTEDCTAVRTEIERLFREDRYADALWGIEKK